MNVERLGRRIRELRIERKLSATAVAKRALLDRSDYWRIENGRGPKSIGIDRLERIAKALGVPLSALLEVSKGRRVAPGRRAAHTVRTVPHAG